MGSREAGETKELELGPRRGVGCRIRTLFGFCRNRHGTEGETEAWTGRGAGTGQHAVAQRTRYLHRPVPGLWPLPPGLWGPCEGT